MLVPALIWWFAHATDERTRPKSDSPRRSQAGYLDPATLNWVVGLPDDATPADIGYFDMELEGWALDEPDILSGEWMPNDALLATGGPECPSNYPIKGNLPSRVYHLPDQTTSERTIPEHCFARAATAITAGFHPSRAAKRSD